MTRNYTGDYLVNSEIEAGDITVTVSNGIYTVPMQVGSGDYTIAKDFSSAGETTVTVSYTKEGVTKNATFIVNVVNAYTPSYTFSTSATELEVNTDGTAGTSTTYMSFGDCPQTIKAPLVRIDENTKKDMGMFTYYAGSDGNWYCTGTASA